MDVWIGATAENAARLTRALVSFGFSERSIPKQAFVQPDKVIQMGVPPLRIDVLTSVAGLQFPDCYPSRCTDVIDGVDVTVIGLDHLKQNKMAANRPKDPDDLLNLP